MVLKHPDLQVVFAANDLMALGAAEVIRAKHPNGITVIGIDGISDAVKAIKEECMTASVAQLPYLMGQQAVEKAAKTLADKQPLAYDQYVPVVLLNKQMLEAQTDPLLRYLK